MEHGTIDIGPIPASVNVSIFRGQGGVGEHHLIVRPTRQGSMDAQLGWIFDAYRDGLKSLGLDMRSAAFRRFFCSDLANQAAALQARPFSNPRDAANPCAVSWVHQPAGSAAKVSLWAYHVDDPKDGLDKALDDGSFALRRGELCHYWTTGVTCPTAETARDQARGILEKHEDSLKARGMTWADNVVRTWFFVRNIDANYQGLATARREFFALRGLTPQTHFVASTGIEGAHVDPAAKVAMDAYAIAGLRPGQVEYLAAPSHLCPTHVYGVTFERGASVAYRDRKHVIISGTASIDPQGKILYPGDASRQLERALENIEALLKQADATFKDMAMTIVYARDPSDLALAWRRMRERFGEVPLEGVVAPVCRPGWLVEVEGMAIVGASRPDLPAF
jgi:enamine deaminase RidA (YjgF/YER057c/UK114 family)